MSSPAPATQTALTSALALNHVEIIVNSAAGSVGPTAADEIGGIMSEFGIDTCVTAPPPDALNTALQAAIDARPDLLIVLAGDGTARCAAELCGPRGPVLMPLPGGTMNILPHALYGQRDWQTALRDSLAHGIVTPVSGGLVDSHAFYVAAILGAPALWAHAREAVRERDFKTAIKRARHALARAFSGQLRFRLDQGERQSAEALTLISPLISKVMDEQTALEAIALDPPGAMAAFGIGARAVLGDWRADPHVHTQPCKRGQAWARGTIPAILDGEPIRLHSRVDIRFCPKAFSALVPPQAEVSA